MEVQSGEIDTRQHQTFEKELHFGQVMLKRAKRELSRLDAEINHGHGAGANTLSVRSQFDQLETSVVHFEQELAAVQSRCEAGDWTPAERPINACLEMG